MIVRPSIFSTGRPICQVIELAHRPTTPFLTPTPHQRRVIYTAIGEWDDPTARRIRAWLALFAAQHALPVFHAWFPSDDLPLQLVNTALDVLTGDADEEMMHKMAEWGYHAAGHSWGYDEDEIPLSVDYAGQAAYHALGSTTHGLYFLQDIDTGYHTVMSTGMHMGAHHQMPLRLLFRVLLHEYMAPSNLSLRDLMDEIGSNAAARGLTPALLEQLLNDDA